MEPCGVEPNGYFIKDGVAVIMIIGEIEGHENTGDSIKTTRYDHLIPLMVICLWIRRSVDFYS